MTINIFQKIKISYFKSLKGEERLWKVFWLWGALLYMGSYLVGFYSFLLYQTSLKSFQIHNQNPNQFLSKIYNDVLHIPMGMIGILGFTLIFLYPFVLIFSLFRCINKGDLKYIFLILVWAVIFLSIHFYYAVLLLIISFGSTTESVSGSILTITLIIFIIYKTRKELRKTSNNSQQNLTF